MTGQYDLTKGKVSKKLILVALPLIGSQLIQMTYNLTDMFWLGRLSSEAVAASGTVGMYILLSLSVMLIGRMGAEIGVAQYIGSGKKDIAEMYAKNSLWLATLVGILLASLYAFGRSPLIAFFKIQELNVSLAAELYLLIIAIGIPFTFITAVVTGIYNGNGNAKVPFKINCVGISINIILDPLLIFTFKMGIAGAAIATIVAQIVTCILSIFSLIHSRNSPFKNFETILVPSKKYLSQILKWSVPIAIEGFLFTFISMIVSRFVASYGADAISAQRIGSQIENLSWLIGGAFSSALTAFIGQNYGAQKLDRINSGFKSGVLIMAIWGLFVAALMFFGAHLIFNFFLPNDTEASLIGVLSLKILAVSQLFICFESAAIGAFRGIGKTFQPSIISALTNIFRVLLAYLLMRTSLGLNGIWISLSVGSIIRGLWMLIAYIITSKTHFKYFKRESKYS
ncbi:MATE family efflux transporter [Erysipelotrichaceae bacterium OttesenSCG-928-M19]|nr:MATE family efflux transporter [Erysipelotrichaceae bacterium OttesenSCG-928-M19]